MNHSGPMGLSSGCGLGREISHAGILVPTVSVTGLDDGDGGFGRWHIVFYADKMRMINVGSVIMYSASMAAGFDVQRLGMRRRDRWRLRDGCHVIHVLDENETLPVRFCRDTVFRGGNERSIIHIIQRQTRFRNIVKTYVFNIWVQ